MAWVTRCLKLKIRSERREDTHEAFLHLGSLLICLNYLM
jgi:hypothetical protein